MCGSDLHGYRGLTPMVNDGELVIQGHEPCGVIEEVGPGVDARTVAAGDRVMIHHYWGCGACVSCRSGWTQLCTEIAPRITTVNEHGGHAEFIKVPARQTMPLDESLSFRAGAAIGCGTGTAWGALARAGDVSGKDVLVLGQGPVGASVAMLASALGARVIVTDVASHRLAQARSFGAHEVIDGKSEDVVERVRELTAGRGAAVIVETTGVSAVAAQAIELVAVWGTVVLVGVGADVSFNTKTTMKRQFSLVTSWTLSTVQQLQCAEFVVRKDLPVDAQFSHSWSIEQAEQAYEWFDAQSDGKGVFEP